MAIDSDLKNYLKAVRIEHDERIDDTYMRKGTLPEYNEATSLQSGLMSAADKQKLDEIDAGATAGAQLIDASNGFGCANYTGLVIAQGANSIIAEGYDGSDFTNIYFSNGERAINMTNTPPRASANNRGGVKVTGYDGLIMDGDTLKAADSLASNFTLPPATADSLGGVIAGDGLGMANTPDGSSRIGDGGDKFLYLKTASATQKGGVKVTGNDGLIMQDGVLKVADSLQSGTGGTISKSELDAILAKFNCRPKPPDDLHILKTISSSYAITFADDYSSPTSETITVSVHIDCRDNDASSWGLQPPCNLTYEILDYTMGSPCADITSIKYNGFSVITTDGINIADFTITVSQSHSTTYATETIQFTATNLNGSSSCSCQPIGISVVDPSEPS